MKDEYTWAKHKKLNNIKSVPLSIIVICIFSTIACPPIGIIASIYVYCNRKEIAEDAFKLL